MSAHFTVVRVAGDHDLDDREVFQILERQFSITGSRMEISVRATEEQVDRAMEKLMQRVAKFETRRLRRGLAI